jgi:hypothetical protein
MVPNATAEPSGRNADAVASTIHSKYAPGLPLIPPPYPSAGSSVHARKP